MLSWQILLDQLKDCSRCPLCQTRHNIVVGEGNFHAKIMMVGEGPGAEEDRLGRPFVGRAGQLLDKMIAAIGLKREDVYIANIVKCRPPQNRVPTPEEANACLDFLRGQFRLIRPSIIVCLGATPSRYILDESVRITRDRGNWTKRGNVWIMPTFHPAALLRDESKKWDAWEDFKMIRDKLKELTEQQNDDIGTNSQRM